MRITAKALIALLACTLLAGSVVAATVTINPAQLTNGYMNVYDLGNNYLWGSGWGFADLTAVYSGDNLTLGPNTIGDPNEYWYIGGGAPGNPATRSCTPTRTPRWTTAPTRASPSPSPAPCW